MSSIFAIPEIQACILRYTNRQTDARCARINKEWQEPALDALWYHIDRLEGLFALLGTMEPPPGPRDTWKFLTRYISSHNWDRFFFYSKRIRHLTYNNTCPGIDHSVFATISFFRPVLHILPNLTHLTWEKDPSQPALSLRLCLLFLAPGLKSLTVKTGVDSFEGDLFAISNFFNQIVFQCPQLEHITFSSEISFRSMGPMVPQFLGSLVELKTASLSEGLICSDVLTALAASCPQLEAIRCITPKSELYPLINSGGGVEDLENLMPYITQDGFRSIRTLHLTAHLWNIVYVLRSIPTASQIRELVVRTMTLESSKNVEGFFATISTICPNIKALSLSIQVSSLEEFEPLPFSSIAPLLMCASLTSLSVESPSMLDINDAEAASMASSWPKLESLHLNPYPIPQIPKNIHLTFATMSILAQYCPRLLYLGICVRAPEIPMTEAQHTFLRLRKLVLGLMDVNYDQDAAALFLADLVPSTCTLVNTPPPPNTEPYESNDTRPFFR